MAIRNALQCNRLTVAGWIVLISGGSGISVYLFIYSLTQTQECGLYSNNAKEKDIYNNESKLDLTNITIQHCFKMTEKFRAK